MQRKMTKTKSGNQDYGRNDTTCLSKHIHVPNTTQYKITPQNVWILTFKIIKDEKQNLKLEKVNQLT